jgi:hypothetical protein
MKPLPLIRLLTLALALAALGPSAALAESAEHMVIVTPADLKWTDATSMPSGAKVAVIEGQQTKQPQYTLRIKFPADYKLPAHWHPAIERVTVISGTFNLGMGDKLDTEKTKALTPGSTAIIQPLTNHFAWTSEETVIQLHGVGPHDIHYVDPADDPRKK